MDGKRHLPVVIGQGSYNDLGVIRSLGEARVKSVYLTDGDSVIPIRKSSYLLETLTSNLESGLYEALEQIHAHYHAPLVLYPTSDSVAAKLDELYSPLSSFAVAPHANGRLLGLMDKARQAGMAKACGFDVPVCQTLDLNEGSAVAFPFPCIVKPRFSVLGKKEHIAVCRNADELHAALSVYRESGETSILLQEYIDPGNIREVCFTGVALGHGRVVVGGMVTKHRIVGNGSTSFGTFRPSVPSQQQQAVSRFIAQTGFNGLFDMECFVGHDGHLLFIECNFRNGAYGYAATRAGVNLPLQYYLGMLGQDLPHGSTRKVVFMEERVDVLNVKAGRITLLRWLRDVCRTNVFLYSNWRDPGPMLRVPHTVARLFKF